MIQSLQKYSFVLTFFFLSLCGEVFCQKPPAPKPAIQLSDLFSVDSNPGAGSLDFGKTGAVQTIELGAKGGRFAMGIVFPASVMPPQIAKDIGSRSVLQIVFGTLRAKLTTEVPQFAFVSLFTDHLPVRAKTFPVLSDLKSPAAKVFGLLLFTDPSTQAELNGEEKLKRTYFGKKGTVIAQLIGPKKMVEIQNRETTIPFRAQALRLEIGAVSGTPFKPEEEFPLRGKVELPVYWPSEKHGLKMMRKIARESFAVSSGLQTETDPADKPIAPVKRPKKSE